MLLRVLLFLAVLNLSAGFAIAEDARPAGYIMAYELKGADADKGTVVVRNGTELAPKLLMPLYDDDAVFIREEASRITLSLAREGNLVVSGKLMRKDITGEMTSGDDGFSIIEQIAAILAGDSDDNGFSVLVSKGGDEIKAPAAVRGRNYVLRDGGALHLAWLGGEAPFSVRIDQGQGGEAARQEARDIEIPLARIAGRKFAVTVTDARKKKLRVAFELRKAAPKVPDEVKARDSNGTIAAVWLAGRENGAWRMEALRRLRALPQDKTTMELIAALEQGWLPK
ncbi:hypothetical protein [Taklimakanibacter lacteus]|uniref:hypothetical protein n=1 Tax=Taklimakanibacter lacteus TaxID=2268456 RepID=UPI000E66B1A7